MAEALIAVSVAANVVQFLDFGSRFFSSCWDIYTSSRDGIGELPDLQAITKDFDGILKDLKCSDSKSLPGEDRAFQPLLAKCQELADQLLVSLRKIDCSNKVRKRDAVKEAIRRLWSDEIYSLQVRLEQLRQELIVHLLGLIRRQGQKSLEHQENLQAKIQTLDEGGKRVENAIAQLLHNQAGIGDTILKGLVSRTRLSERQQMVEVLQGDLLSALHNTAAVHESLDSPTPLVSYLREKHLQEIFLGRLRYHNMEDREERIAEPYKDTFRWIFDDDSATSNSWSNFKDWLESESSLYWLTGKAGSGKSTLMKFICQPTINRTEFTTAGDVPQQARHRCNHYLSRWKADLPLVVASFYFWNSGDPLQMSQRGLFMTLLSQIIQQVPKIIPAISPRRWESLCLFNEDPRAFSDSELQAMISSAIKELTKYMKICLFIDGLDEFEGTQQDLIGLIMNIISNPNVKICVASRPWVEFQDAFNHRPNLLLQDLTYFDRKHFVVTKLERDSNYHQLRRREPVYADQLVENIVSKSSGVFLWVKIVVKSLLAGMNNGDRVIDLQRRLDALPPDLENLYDKILASLDPFYLEHAAQLFRLVQESHPPVSLRVLSFADEIDLSTAISRPLETMKDDEVALRLDTMQRRLNSRCKGLLEVSRSRYNGEHIVQYLHRTVKDYISSKRAKETLQLPPTSPFNPHLRLCAGSLLYLKTLDTKLTSWHAEIAVNVGGLIQNSITQCMHTAARLQKTSPNLTISALDELRAVINDIVARWTRYRPLKEFSDMKDNPTSKFIDKDPSNCESFERTLLYHYYDLKRTLTYHFPPFDNLPYRDFDGLFLSLVLHHGHIEYIRVRSNSQVANTSQLLMDSIDSVFVHREPIIQLEIMDFLLTKGADPNFMLIKESPPIMGSVWLQTVCLICMDTENSGKTSDVWLEVIKKMISHGAKGEERFLCQYDPMMQTTNVNGSKVITERSEETRLSQVQSVFRKNEVRLSKALELGDYSEIILFGEKKKKLEKLRLYNLIQGIRRSNKAGRPSKLSMAWKMKNRTSGR